MKYLFLLMLIFVSKSWSIELINLRNNKEIISNVLKKKEMKHLNAWIKYHRHNEEELLKRSKGILEKSLQNLKTDSDWCEINFIRGLIKLASLEGVIQEESEIYNFLYYIREQNLIDDILLKIMMRSSLLFENLNSYLYDKQDQSESLSTEREFEILYKKFKSLNEESKGCINNVYRNFSDEVYRTYKRTDSKFILRLNRRAYSEGIINYNTFEILKILNFSNVTEWDLTLQKYLTNLVFLKDRLTKKVEENAETDLPQEYIFKYQQITRREKLYKEFSQYQILLMAQLIEKTAKRIDAKESGLYFDFENTNSEREIYIFSPMEQYRVALKMLRKDIAEVKRSERFSGQNFDYEDIIMAAYETGIISSKDLNYVLKFEEFWNPKISRWKRLANLSLNIAGSATFLLPSPFNYISAIALIFTQSAISNGTDTIDPETNGNVII